MRSFDRAVFSRQPRSIRPAAARGTRGAALALGALVVALPVVGQSPGAGSPPPATDQDPASQTIRQVVDRVGPATVTIGVLVGDQAQGGPIAAGTGSGVIIDPDGLILTNRHVAGDATSLTVTLEDGRQFEGTLAGVDTLTDFAFVRIEGEDLPSAELGDSSNLAVGQLVIAIGDPLGQFPGTVTVGVVSGLDRTIPVSDASTGETTLLRHAIQTDAAINPGNSGGPLADAGGMVIGINTAGSGEAQGIGFALPIDLAKPIIEQVRAGEPIARPYIGIAYVDLTGQIVEDEDLPVTNGALIRADPQGGLPAIVPGGPADAAGLRDGDIILSVDGTQVDRDHQLDLLLLQHNPGDRVELEILRDGRERTVEVTLGTRPAGE